MLKNKKPTILVTNDDGIRSNGIKLLTEIALQYGNVIVVAPSKVQSAKSHSITQAKTITCTKIPNTPNYEAYACSGTPVDCVKIAIQELSQQPVDLVLSGINHGINSSVSVIYSGTMAAAIEATMNGIPAIGFSVNNYNHKLEFPEITPFIKQVIEEAINQDLSPDISLNVNFPNPATCTTKGLKVCRPANGRWEEKFVDANDPYGRKSYWLDGTFIDFEPDSQDTDEHAMREGYASVVPVRPQFTQAPDIEIIKKWNL